MFNVTKFVWLLLRRAEVNLMGRESNSVPLPMYKTDMIFNNLIRS
jgi:hypothetical protein